MKYRIHRPFSAVNKFIQVIGEAGEEPYRSGRRGLALVLDVLITVRSATKGILTDIQNMNLRFYPELLFRI